MARTHHSPTTHSVSENELSSFESGGREGIRTPGLLVANEALSQLSYSPTSSSKSILAKQKWLANTRCPRRFQQGNELGLRRMQVSSTSCY